VPEPPLPAAVPESLEHAAAVATRRTKALEANLDRGKVLRIDAMKLLAVTECIGSGQMAHGHWVLRFDAAAIAADYNTNCDDPGASPRSTGSVRQGWPCVDSSGPKKMGEPERWR